VSQHTERIAVSRILGWYDIGLYWVVVVLTAVLAVMGFTTVVFRYVLQSSLFWGDEFLRYLMIWLVFLGGALATRHRALITVDIFTQPLPHRARALTTAAVFAAATLFLLTLASISLELARRSVGTVSASMGIPMEWMYLVFPVGLGLMALNTLREAISQFRSASRGEPHTPPGAPTVPDLLVHPE
jgi:TRAP-type C4-dicarboxylate transport system permease small subunit